MFGVERNLGTVIHQCGGRMVAQAETTAAFNRPTRTERGFQRGHHVTGAMQPACGSVAHADDIVGGRGGGQHGVKCCRAVYLRKGHVHGMRRVRHRFFIQIAFRLLHFRQRGNNRFTVAAVFFQHIRNSGRGRLVEDTALIGSLLARFSGSFRHKILLWEKYSTVSRRLQNMPDIIAHFRAK